MPHPFSYIEKKWQEYWEKNQTFKTKEDLDKPKYYVLDMFPYPSGSGLHVGHPEGYTATDIVARYKRMCNYNVLHPMGWDAFGLPAERYASVTGIHPATTTKQNIDNFRRQLKSLGFSYDWDKEINTTDPNYYKWTQWIFLKIFNSYYDEKKDKACPISELDIPANLNEIEKNDFINSKRLAYIKEAPVNFCSELKTILANEEVEEWKSKGYTVERRQMRQWLLRITAYSKRLIDDLNLVDWPKSTLLLQKNWIGESKGVYINFDLINNKKNIISITETKAKTNSKIKENTYSEIKANTNSEKSYIKVFTTRPDTIFGVTFLVLAPEHPLVNFITNKTQKSKVEEYILQTNKISEVERMVQSKNKKKTGVFTGAYVTHPFTNKKIPVWIADYVLMGYGTGAVMGVPSSDERDEEFANTFSLENIKINSEDRKYINSDFLNNLGFEECFTKIILEIEKRKIGKSITLYKLRDWLFSRQRYWGEPIPISTEIDSGVGGDLEASGDGGAGSVMVGGVSGVGGGNSGGEGSDKIKIKKTNEINKSYKENFYYPLTENELPLLLPDVKDFQPSDDGQSPLAKINDWLYYKIKNNKTNKEIFLKRETNTMPQWAGSCWYYLRFISPDTTAKFVDEQKEKYWMSGGGVDLYVGGAEHAVLHLLYARFWHKFLYDYGYVSTPEPFKKLVHQGLILGEDGQKMSKSRGNVVNPDDVVKVYGADAFRLYEMFLGPLEKSKPWSTKGIEGVSRFLLKVWRLYVLDLSDNNIESSRENNIGNIRENNMGNTRENNIESSRENNMGNTRENNLGNIRENNIKISSENNMGNTRENNLGNIRENNLGNIRENNIGNTRENNIGNTRENNLGNIRENFDYKIDPKLLEEDKKLDCEFILHNTIKKVKNDIENLSFNTAISSLMIFINEVSVHKQIGKDAAEIFIKLLYPFAPHISEELWFLLGNNESLAYQDFPNYDDKKTLSKEVEVVFQVNSKVRAKTKASVGLSQEEMLKIALADKNVQKFIENKEFKRILFVQDKLINIVC